ncbi:hypothetical protein DC429_10085 [Arthrobacter sp. TPD3018]|uniref:hypothetical protein n=1 Tax=Bacteria TaxID=2 RepID=UPI000D50908C|nr:MULTISPECIES: hypothetical protein [Bacteria]PVE57762.1 hypothetical protein DC425_07925 [Sphingomonas sp. TPD3009]PVE58634.1 hypothetical protein DC429_10085 [Arthrobacter sp. TPD3018]PVE86157.1 hypothetical protein DC431_10075 [Sphingomonas melonis]
MHQGRPHPLTRPIDVEIIGGGHAVDVEGLTAQTVNGAVIGMQAAGDDSQRARRCYDSAENADDRLTSRDQRQY